MSEHEQNRELAGHLGRLSTLMKESFHIDGSAPDIREKVGEAERAFEILDKQLKNRESVHSEEMLEELTSVPIARLSRVSQGADLGPRLLGMESLLNLTVGQVKVLGTFTYWHAASLQGAIQNSPEVVGDLLGKKPDELSEMKEVLDIINPPKRIQGSFTLGGMRPHRLAYQEGMTPQEIKADHDSRLEQGL